MHLAGFLNAGPVVHSHALWRHPLTRGTFLDAALYREAAQTLERGKFDLLFFADRLAVSDGDGNPANRDLALRHGSQDAARLDPVPILGLLAGTTERLGLGATRSTTYFQPYQIARTFATLDHLSGGRAAWNVVTSMNDSEARNFGLEKHLAHDTRYDRADEFLHVTNRLWDGWDDNALVLDRPGGIFANPDAVRATDHRGKWFQVAGPLNIPRSPQGRPVIIQAGSSGRGRRFGARWAEVIFTIQTSEKAMHAFRSDVHALVAEHGRAPETCKVLPAIMPFIGDTGTEAREKRDAHNALTNPAVGVSTLAGHLNFDLGQFPLTTPLHAIVAAPETPDYARGRLGEMAAGDPDLTLEQLGRRFAASVRVPQFAGTPGMIADDLTALFRAGAADGFVISPAYLPGTFTEFVDRVVPELQRRGVFRTDYAGPTLRDHLGLARPAVVAG